MSLVVPCSGREGEGGVLALPLCHTYNIMVWQRGCVERVSAHVGRPRVKNRKDVKYSIRLDEEMEKRLRRYCERVGITKGELIRRGIEMILKDGIGGVKDE